MSLINDSVFMLFKVGLWLLPLVPLELSSKTFLGSTFSVLMNVGRITNPAFANWRGLMLPPPVISLIKPNVLSGFENLDKRFEMVGSRLVSSHSSESLLLLCLKVCNLLVGLLMLDLIPSVLRRS